MPLGSDPSTGKVKIKQGLLACEYVSLVTTFLHTAFLLNYFSIIAQDSMHISDFWSILCPLIIEAVIRVVSDGKHYVSEGNFLVQNLPGLWAVI